MNITEKEVMCNYSLAELCQMVDEFDHLAQEEFHFSIEDEAKIRKLSQKIFGKDNLLCLMGCMVLLAEELKDRIKEMGGIK